MKLKNLGLSFVVLLSGVISHAAFAVDPLPSPFLKRTAGLFDLVYPKQASTDFGKQSTFLWYAGFGSGPETWMVNDPTAKKQVDRVYLEATASQMIVQLGYEPHFAYQNQLHGLNLGTLVDALDVPDFESTVAKINLALERGEDPFAVLPTRTRTFQALKNDQWVSVTLDINRFLIAPIKWARYLKDKPTILRPMSEMNESSSGSWSFGKHPLNTPERLARAWVLLQRLTRLSGAINTWFVFAPLTYQETLVQGDLTIRALTLIAGTAPETIDALGLNVYSTLPPSGEPIDFYSLVTPWISAFNSIEANGQFPLRGLPLMVPEMGINRFEFPSDATRAGWIREAYQAAGELGFSSVTYFHAGSSPSDFTVIPRPKGSAQAGEDDFEALKDGISKFQLGQ